MLKLILTHIEDALLFVWNKIKRTSLFIVLTNKIFPVLVFISLVTSSCLKDDLEFDKLETSNWEPSVAVPLAFTSMSIEDLLKNEQDSGNLFIDSNKFCTLIYSGRSLEIKANELVSIPDQHINQEIQLNDTIVDIINTTGDITFSYFENIDFSMPNGVEIDSVTFKNGTIWLTINSRIPANVTIDIIIPDATKNGIPFAQNIMLPYSGTLPVSATLNSELDDYKLDMTNGGVTHNQLRVDYTVHVTTTGTPVEEWNKVNISFAFTGNHFWNVFGYFGQQNLLSPEDTINITLFNSLQGLGTFTIAEPEIKIDFINSFGLPVRASVTKMTGLNGNLTNFVVASGIPDPLPIFYPDLNQIGQSMTGTFTMSNANSNVAAMIANQPKYVISQVQSTTNPDGHLKQNFVTDSSRFAIDMEVKLPLYGNANNFHLIDTLNFNYNNLQNVQELMIRTSLTNGFPIDVNFQIYFVEENFSLLDSLVYTNQLLMPSAIVDPVTGSVISPTLQITDHTLNRTRVLKIMNAKKLIFKASATSVNNGNTEVKIYSDYRFDVNLGAIAKVIL